MRRPRTSMRLLAVAAVAAAALAVPAIARAGEHDHGRHGRAMVRVPVRPFVAPVPRVVAPRVVAPRAMAPRVIVVPRMIPVREHGAWAPYRYGSVYYAPHRHRHELYAFPVVTPAGVVVRQFPYCDGHVFLAASLPLPHISVRIGF